MQMCYTQQVPAMAIELLISDRSPQPPEQRTMFSKGDCLSTTHTGRILRLNAACCF